jgi:hypothetical protein
LLVPLATPNINPAMKTTNTTVDLDSEKYSKILDSLTFDDLLYEISCLKEINEKTARNEFEITIQHLVMAARNSFECNLKNIVEHVNSVRKE